MTARSFWTVVLASALAPSSAATGDDAAEGELLLVVGEQRVMDAEGVESFSDSTRGVIEVKVPRDGRRLVVTALKPGQTSLLLIGHGGGQRTIPITVYARRPEAIEQELRLLVEGQGDLELRRLGPRIFIDGQVATAQAQARLERIAKVYAGQVESLAQVSASVVERRPNIRLDLAFVELRAAEGLDLGVDWPSPIGGTQTLSAGYDFVSGTPSASYRVVDQALPALEAAATAGHARIRKRATLVTTSGVKASYSAGGEVNVAVAGSQAAELRSVPYGCRLTVLPRLAEKPGLIDLDVDAEVSDLTETTQDVPGRTISRVTTLVHLGPGQSVMLSGLDAESETETTTGLPLLSSIPILGRFFGTTSHRDERVEGLIVITPTILDEAARDAGARLERAKERFESFDGDIDDLDGGLAK